MTNIAETSLQEAVSVVGFDPSAIDFQDQLAEILDHMKAMGWTLPSWQNRATQLDLLHRALVGGLWIPEYQTPTIFGALPSVLLLENGWKAPNSRQVEAWRAKRGE